MGEISLSYQSTQFGNLFQNARSPYIEVQTVHKLAFMALETSLTADYSVLLASGLQTRGFPPLPALRPLLNQVQNI